MKNTYNWQLGEYLYSHDGPIYTFTPQTQDSDSLIETIVVGHGNRHDVQLEQISECFYPVTGKNQTRGSFSVLKKPSTYADRVLDLHKIYYDDESYNKGHGHAYEFLGIDPKQGALVIVRPDQCESSPRIMSHLSITDYISQMYLPL